MFLLKQSQARYKTLPIFVVVSDDAKIVFIIQFLLQFVMKGFSAVFMISDDFIIGRLNCSK